MEHSTNGSWKLNLNGICYRQLMQLGEMLKELGEKGELYGEKFDLETLTAIYNSYTDEVNLYDEDGTTTEESEE